MLKGVTSCKNSRLDNKKLSINQKTIKKMKHFFAMLILVSSTILSAQPNSNSDIKNGSISGRVLDAQLNEPLPYVNVIVKDATDKLITGGITNSDGTFDIKKNP